MFFVTNMNEKGGKRGEFSEMVVESGTLVLYL